VQNVQVHVYKINKRIYIKDEYISNT
jgi:hypothetical protein